MDNFDRFVGIDWTGAKTPVVSKSIAVAECIHGLAAPCLVRQDWSRQKLCDFIEQCLSEGHRTLIGMDCNFGYAQDILKKQLGPKATAHDLWRTVDTLNQDEANFFAGRFWTHEDYKSDFWTEGKKPKGFHLSRRITETQCGEKGYGWPESPFKMIGAKQVGKGGLAGMRLAHYLKSYYRDKVCIWPFDDPTIWNKATIVITEIYPRQFIMRAGLGLKKLRNATDLNKALEAMKSAPMDHAVVSDHDTDALVTAAGMRHLCGQKETLPKALSQPIEDRAVLTCEGWIFGVGFTPPNEYQEDR